MRGMVRRFWGLPVERWTDRLDDLRAFSPLPEVVTDAVLAGAALSVVALSAVCVVDALWTSGDGEEDAA